MPLSPGDLLAPPRRVRVRTPASTAVVVLLLALVVALVQVAVLLVAFRSLGLSEGWALAALLASVVGGAVNVPLLTLHVGRPAPQVVRTALGWLIAVAPPRSTVLAINAGGGVLPVALSGYLLYHTGITADAAIGVVVVAALVHRVARVVPDVGVVAPALAPALFATGVTLVLHPPAAPALAYVCGTLGTLIGADITNLRRVARSGPAVIAIGGAGSFDGIVLAGSLAVILVGLV